MFSAHPTMDISTIQVTGAATGLKCLPLDEFFRNYSEYMKSFGKEPDFGDTLPLPEGAEVWNIAVIDGETVLICVTGDHLHMIADVGAGRMYFHYIKTEQPSVYKVSLKKGIRQIRKRGLIMGSLEELAKRNSMSLGARQGMMQNMNLGGGAGTGVSNVDVSQDMPSGITGTVDTRTINRVAKANAYVFGHICGAAPQTTLGVSRKTDTKNNRVCDIVARQSKPGRHLQVLMSLPAKCVLRQGAIARPEDIMAGSIDWSADMKESIKVAMDKEAAIAYILALGNMIPEYAPNVVEGAKSQWDMKDILADGPGVSFVYVTSSVSTAQNYGANKMRYRLKSTSPRRTLFTRGNHVCLTAVEHISIPESPTAAEAYELNQCAFAHLQYRSYTPSGGGLPIDSLTRAITDCPGKVWRTVYEIDGERKDGIGSCFFMEGNSVQTEGGETVTRKQLNFWPWYQSGAYRPEMPTPCKSIVRRTYKPATDTAKARMVTEKLTLKDNPAHPMFKPYKKFIDEAIKEGYITREKLDDMCGRKSTGKKKSYALDPQAKVYMQTYLGLDSVSTSINNLLDEYATRSILDGESK